MAAVRHFGFVGKFWDDPQREFNGLYHCAKFGAVVILIIQMNILFVWPENAYSHPFLAVLWIKIVENGKFLNCYLFRNAITWNCCRMKQFA